MCPKFSLNSEVEDGLVWSGLVCPGVWTSKPKNSFSKIYVAGRKTLVKYVVSLNIVALWECFPIRTEIRCGSWDLIHKQIFPHNARHKLWPWSLVFCALSSCFCFVGKKDDRVHAYSFFLFSSNKIEHHQLPTLSPSPSK